MLEASRRLDLLEEPISTQEEGDFLVKNLQRDLAIVLEIIRQVHNCAAALAELALNVITAT
jgi:hypothetical protein